MLLSVNVAERWSGSTLRAGACFHRACAAVRRKIYHGWGLPSTCPGSAVAEACAGDTTERPERFHATAFACPLLLC
ncbi:hypothetical protein NQZ68_033851 [Dissostichus eleginoides]|nr:hypothetical protein NQZ68_033851 [Dissostichus eleginoides]